VTERSPLFVHDKAMPLGALGSSVCLLPLVGYLGRGEEKGRGEQQQREIMLRGPTATDILHTAVFLSLR
jgi:hypothetical protein